MLISFFFAPKTGFQYEPRYKISNSVVCTTSKCSWERNGSVVECLTPDREAAELVQPRKTRHCLTERLLMGRKESNQSNKQAKAQTSLHIRAVLSEPLVVVAYYMSIKVLTEHHLEFLSLNGGCTGSSESTFVKIPHCWKSHVAAELYRLRSKIKRLERKRVIIIKRKYTNLGCYEVLVAVSVVMIKDAFDNSACFD